ncbi:MAG: OmpA family protein [Candidatus Tectomicrobia bacterium]|nr:OmpA family protein [Candidatus Tectomicrobia bacterium]
MAQGLRVALILLLLGAAAHAPGAFAETDCEQAKADYDRAVQQTDPAEALALLDGVVARCPGFNAWFVKGNAHRMLEQWGRALAAYRQAEAQATTPRRTFVAQAYGALMGYRLGRACEAVRTFRALGAASDEPLPAWLRGPYEAFERLQAETPMDAGEMACALRVTAHDRTLRVCPRLNVRIPFAYDRADIDEGNRSKVEELAKALRQVHDGTQRYRLVGHTDSRGSAAYNQNLSERRARSVRAFIGELQGDLRGALEARGEGESRLLAMDDEDSSHALNRRVEVQVVCEGG